MILRCPCIIDFMGGMVYKGEWGGGGPGHSWALKWHERSSDAGDPGSIPGGGNLNVCLQLGSRVIINIMHLFFHPPHPTTGA
jgi:hypothetical protein